MTAKLLGACVLLVSSILIGRIYESYCERRLLELSEILRMLAHIRSKISSFLCPQSLLLSDFESEVLEESGFLRAVGEGKTLADAYKASRLLISKKDGRALEAYFAELGKSYKDEELSRLDRVYRELDESFKCESERVPKDVKVAKTLLTAAALGISVLMI